MKKHVRVNMINVLIISLSILVSGIAPVNADHGESLSLIRNFHIESPRNVANPISAITSSDEIVVMGEVGGSGGFPTHWNNSMVQVRTEPGGFDIFLAKISNSDEIMWNYYFNGVGDNFFGMEVDSDNNIILIGSSSIGNIVENESYINDGSGWKGMTVYGDIPDINNMGKSFITKLSPDGIVSWIRFFDFQDKRVLDVSSDSDNNLIVMSTHTRTNGFDFFLTKLDTNGNILWDNVSDTGSTINGGITIDHDDNILFSRRTRVSSSSTDNLLSKYSSDGDLVWEKDIENAATPRSITVDSSNNIYLSGFSSSLFWTAAYTSDGDNIWSTTFAERGTGHAIIIGPHDDVFIAGETFRDNFPGKNSFDIEFGEFTEGFIVRLNGENGNFISSAFLGGSGGDMAYDIAIDSNDNILVTGVSDSLEFLDESETSAITPGRNLFISYIKVSDEYTNSAGGAIIDVELFGIFAGMSLLVIIRNRKHSD